MKKRFLKGIVLMMTFMLVLPMLSFANSTTAEAKKRKKYNPKPTFSITQMTLGEGETFTVSLENLGSQVKKVYWYTQNSKVAIVNVNDKKTATVTAKRQGTTFIKCKVTYKNGTAETPACKVKVYTKADSINIYNADLNNQGFHILEVGERFKFKAKTAPGNSKYNTYWFIDNDNVARLYSDGTVKGLKEGVVQLTAVAAISSESAKMSTIRHTITILVVNDNYNGNDDYDYDDDYDHDDGHHHNNNNLLPLPAPVSIVQDKDDNSIINIQFNNLLDEVSAKKVSNYSIPGVTITSAELTNSINSAIVKLKVQPGSIQATQNYLISIAGVKGYNNTFEEMNLFQATITLKENKAPELVSFTYYYPTGIMLVFNETITGTPSFKVMQNNVDLVLSTFINDKSILITLKSTPEMSKFMELLPAETNKIVDLAGNRTLSILNRYMIPSNN